MRIVSAIAACLVAVGCASVDSPVAPVSERPTITPVTVRYTGSAQEIYIYVNHVLNSILWTDDNISDTVWAAIGDTLEARYLSNPLFRRDTVVSENMTWQIR
jgi:hypothetical protein